VPAGLEALPRPSHAFDIDSLDAQCLLTRLAEGEVRPPDVWKHERSGALSCAYEGGEAVFTWSADDVGAMARTWRDSQAVRPPRSVRSFRCAHERLAALANEAGLGPADMIVHDLRRGEVRGAWQHDRIIVVVENIDEGS
jgi:hypothetical protein